VEVPELPFEVCRVAEILPNTLNAGSQDVDARAARWRPPGSPVSAPAKEGIPPNRIRLLRETAGSDAYFPAQRNRWASTASLGFFAHIVVHVR
jgi:hypothetical protein